MRVNLSRSADIAESDSSAGTRGLFLLISYADISYAVFSPKHLRNRIRIRRIVADRTRGQRSKDGGYKKEERDWKNIRSTYLHGKICVDLFL